MDSGYNDSYKSLFETLMAKNQEQYKIEWLKLSLRAGHKLERDGFYVMQSVEKNLPYFCETKQEFDRFFNSEVPVLRGSLTGMLTMAAFYGDIHKANSHPLKRQYWQEKLRELANNDNYEAQGALCSDLAILAFGASEVESSRSKYETRLRQLAEAGNGLAQLAVGKFMSIRKSKEQMEWFFKAAQQGFSDAWYELGRVYETAINYNSNDLPRDIALSEEKQNLLRKKAVKCYLNGAEADNGIMAACCQYKVARFYKDGNFLLPQNNDLAIYWYQRAFDNGDERAIRDLEVLTGTSPVDAKKKMQKLSYITDNESKAVTECMQFFAVMFSIRERAKQEDDIYPGEISCDTGSRNDNFLLYINMRVPQWGWYLRNSDETWRELFSSILERALTDAKKNEPRLQAVKSFSDLNIMYSLNYTMGEDWISFEKRVYFNSSKENIMSEMERALIWTYSGMYRKDRNGLIKM